MKKKILNYLVIVELDKRIGSNANCYTSYCPTLGLADSGDTIEEALANMRDLIVFHLKALQKEKGAIPEEQTEKSVVTMVQVPYPST